MKKWPISWPGAGHCRHPYCTRDRNPTPNLHSYPNPIPYPYPLQEYHRHRKLARRAGRKVQTSHMGSAWAKWLEGYREGRQQAEVVHGALQAHP